MKQKRINMRWLVVVMVAVMMTVACGSNPAGNGVVDGNYPMPTMQEECVNHLYDVLMSPEGRAMTGAQLAALNDTGRLRNVFRIDPRPFITVSYDTAF